MTRKQHTVPDYEAIVQEHYARALDIDGLPVDGPRHQKNTAFQARRREQVVFLRNIWPLLFPNSLPTSVEARDIMGQAKTDSVADVLECLAHAAAYQHKGRGVTKRERDGTAKRDDNGKVQRTRRKINSDIAYAKAVVRRMLGGELDTPQLPPATVTEEPPLALPNPATYPNQKALALPAPRSNGHNTEHSRTAGLAAYESQRHRPEDDNDWNF